ncbi:Panacea domain-containing protein [Exiguobacterium artemiae]|uniref:Panacea domain-containing protein n=1 Tax=Exiguobacterium artemiae TaxID=340145 RepID=UPI00047D87DF|nr:type II toxin-antitoxin system antitoxin SocA domain-containing protein [Exiguobacterium sibiricum]
MARVKDVARYFIDLSVESTPYAITPLKLQKLLYYAQGFHLINTGERLFRAELEAWAHGPVVREIYFEYKEFGYHTITSKPFINKDLFLETPLLTDGEMATIEEVWEHFGDLDGKTLEELTHQEDPWLNTEINDEIEIKLIREYFKEQYQENQYQH